MTSSNYPRAVRPEDKLHPWHYECLGLLAEKPRHNLDGRFIRKLIRHGLALPMDEDGFHKITATGRKELKKKALAASAEYTARLLGEE